MDLFKGFYTLRKMCPYSELFWSIFSLIWTKYREIIIRISPYSVKMLEITDQKNSEYGYFQAVIVLAAKFCQQNVFMRNLIIN